MNYPAGQYYVEVNIIDKKFILLRILYQDTEIHQSLLEHNIELKKKLR